MNHVNIRCVSKNTLLKSLAGVMLTLSTICTAPFATATTKYSPNGGDIVWCNGDGTPYAEIPGAPGATLPFGTSTVDPTIGLNPPDTWDAWDTNPDLELNGLKLLTSPALSKPYANTDIYAVQLNYWNSIVAANPTYNTQPEYSEPTNTPFGHSAGHSCLSFGEYGNQNSTGFAFVITYPASPSQPNQKEIDFYINNPLDYPNFAPFADFNEVMSNGVPVRTYKGPNPTKGAPTGYISTYKGCSWDGNSCTPGSVIPEPGKDIELSDDTNKFPVKLSNITAFPIIWHIEPYTTPSGFNYFGDPMVKDKTKQVWDATLDIWFDKDGKVDQGKAPYGSVRGQNDGLEIMVWMNSNGSYVDAGGPNNLPTADQPGLAQPTGYIRERVIIGSVLYDAWVGRLNNPYFGYTTSTVIAPKDIPGDCPLSKGKGIAGELCGVEWNVVSLVATKDIGGKDYRQNNMGLTGKDFTDYILGIPNDRVKIQSQVNGSLPRAENVPLQCPASNKNQSPTAPTIDCLSPNWYLMSVQAGFETWIGGNGLMSKNFRTWVHSKATVAQYGLGNTNGQSIIHSKAPFDVIYPGCKNYAASNRAKFYITGTGASGNLTYPADGTQIDMGAQNQKTLQFTKNVAAALSPMRGDAVIHITSACGNVDIPIFVNATGIVTYSDGVTPLQGAKVTLQYSPSGNKNGPYIDVPNLSSIMKNNGNISNPTVTTTNGGFGWNPQPGWYKVIATFNGKTVTSAATQVTVNQPLENLNLKLPLTAPAPIPPAPAISKGVTVNLTPNGTDAASSYCRNVVLKNTNSTAVTWTVQFDLPFAGNFINNWNFNYTKSGKTITATGVGWNNVLAAGKTSDSIGFCATK